MGKTTGPFGNQNFHYDRVYTNGYSLLRSLKEYHKSQRTQPLDNSFVPLIGLNTTENNKRNNRTIEPNFFLGVGTTIQPSYACFLTAQAKP